MAVLNLKYYTGEDFYSDGDVEDEILDIVKKGTDIEELEDKKYPVLYHLSDIRANILNWYPFAEGSSALEIGAGCGAITGVLCDRLDYVASVELSKRRAAINYNRHKNADNLEIYVGNLNDMEFDRRFDYAILNGVLEYAISFTESDNPYVDFLGQIRKHLTDNGKIIIAIENKYGLKYFAGAPEDHTNEYFLGLNNYEGNRSVRTFGKTELAKLLADSGLNYTKFYYPYPDYKFPNEIFTDSTLKTFGYGRDYYNLNGDRYLLFNEERVARGLANEGVAAAFSNSFLIVASASEIKESEDIVYAKINNDRAKQFRILTTISNTESGKIVRKKPICNEAAEHIEDMIKRSSAKVQGVKNQQGALESMPSMSPKAVFEYRYIEHPTLDMDIKELIDRKDAGEIADVLEKLFDAAFGRVINTEYQTDEFKEVFGSDTTGRNENCAKDINIDLICDNVFRLDEGYVVIDCEWVFPFYIPVDFVKWRTVNELYNKYNSLSILMPKQDMLQRLGISVCNEDVFNSWNYHFSKKYVGANSLELYSIPKDTVSLHDIIEHKLPVAKSGSALYIDTGHGFCEEEKVVGIIRLNGDDFEVGFEIPAKWHTKHVRWDPMENILIKVRITDIISDADVSIAGNNGYAEEDGFDKFISIDPNYDIVSDNYIRKICLKGKLKYITEQELKAFYEQSRKKSEYIGELEHRLEDLKQENSILKNTFHNRAKRFMRRLFKQTERAK